MPARIADRMYRTMITCQKRTPARRVAPSLSPMA